LNKIEIKVKEGAVVQAGDQIGTVGTTGSSTGCHLHFEIRKNGVREDPKDVIKEACGITAAAP
jgi:murein DD-endopeptidase MepM/ murein hydrolase activator NlpD